MFGIVIVAGYLLSAMQSTLFGPFELETDYDVGPAPFHDVAPLAVLLVAIIVLGVAPDIFFEMIRDAAVPVVEGGDRRWLTRFRRWRRYCPSSCSPSRDSRCCSSTPPSAPTRGRTPRWRSSAHSDRSRARAAASVWLVVSGTGSADTGGAITLFAEAIKVDTMALFFTAIFASVTALVVVAAHDYFHDHTNPAAFYSLVVFAATGMALLAAANSLAVVFVALEMVSSLPSYVLVAYLKARPRERRGGDESTSSGRSLQQRFSCSESRWCTRRPDRCYSVTSPRGSARLTASLASPDSGS